MATRLVTAIFVFTLSLQLSMAAAAPPIKLFESGRPVRGYDQLVARLKPGEQIRFSNGATFTITHNYVPESGRLDKGTTAVLAISDDKILRLPKRCSAPEECERNQDYLLRFVDGWSLLREFGVAVPQIYLEQSYLPEYVVVERLQVIEKLEDWLQRLSDGQQLDGGRNDLLKGALKKFVAQLSPFIQIGDFYPAQVALTPRGYVLMDWHDGHILAPEFRDSNQFRALTSNTRPSLNLWGFESPHLTSPLSNFRGRPGLTEMISELEETLRAARANRLAQARSFTGSSDCGRWLSSGQSRQ